MGENVDGPRGGRNARVEANPEGDLPFRYDAQLANEIELRWQERWEERGTFHTPNPTGPLGEGFEHVANATKFYVLDMFPYPSGVGLHVGHPLGYIGTDVYARYLRMRGHHVLHPFGYDAFGLPAEQYAIDTGQHPAVTTYENIANMRRQLRRLGLGHDHRRELATTDPGYYKWTQWIFLRLFQSWFDEDANRARPIEELTAEFEAGVRDPVGDANPEGRPWEALSERDRRRVVDSYRLAYLSEAPVNWCPGLGTVLANEEITEEGRSEVGNYPVYRRPLRQWMLRITDYAERLLEGLELLDWSDSIKSMQRNWIGASDGALIEFPIETVKPNGLKVFTTRPDTLPGATYLVLAPEHPEVETLTADTWPKGTPAHWRDQDSAESLSQSTPLEAIEAYRRASSRMTDLRRTDQKRTKTGVFTGSYATNPMTEERIPVFVADYVLMEYGTGAIMGVPAHDERDREFARRFDLPVRPVMEPSRTWFDTNEIAHGTPAADWPVAFVGEGRYLPLDDVIDLNFVNADREDAIQETIRWLEEHGLGRYERSYKLRDWLFSRQRYWGEPFPIVYDEDGLPIPLPEDLLPVELPEMTDFRPQPEAQDSDEPVPPLARIEDWVAVELDLGEGPKTYRREVNTMPQWAGSCWYYLRYLDPTNDQQFVDPEIERYWMMPEGGSPADGGVDLYVGGVEHAVLHLLYARFWHKVLYDLGYVSSKEPFKRLFNQGYILADAFLDSRGMYVPADEVEETPDGDLLYDDEPVTRRGGKMGKSLKNAISPDHIYRDYGADTLRLYEMAMAPLDADRPWRPDDIIGVHRFLQRLWRHVVDERTGELVVEDEPLEEETKRHLHRTIKVVREDFENLQFNTAIARLTELNNHASKIASTKGSVPRDLAEPLVLMVAPLAPHFAEELWSRLGHSESLAREAFPEFDEQVISQETTSIPVQVNDRTRFVIEVPTDADEEEIRNLLTKQPEYSRYTDGKVVERLVVVPGQIVNIVTS